MPNKSKKIRLDLLMTERNLAPSREKARAMIMAGCVLVNEQAVTKAGTPIDPESTIRIKENPIPYVSRGGIKLKSALDYYSLDPTGWTCLDVGASTGGFTDCLLQNGASKVVAVDVGTNQLDWSLRSDPRVICHEKCHIKKLTREQAPDDFDLIVSDVSFISLASIIPDLLAFTSEKTILLLMVKPQFELGREKVGKGGVIKSEKDRMEAIEKVRSAFPVDWNVSQGIPAAIKGPKGNQEYFILAKK